MTLINIELNCCERENLLFNKYLEQVKTCVNAAVGEAGLKYPSGAELSVLLTGDDELQELNKQWRGKDKPTNVLSFPGGDWKRGEPAGLFIGDIAISLDTVKAEAELENKSPDDHFTHLVIHGLLHLFGYDHETDDEAEIMEGLEIRILKNLGVENPYAENSCVAFSGKSF